MKTRLRTTYKIKESIVSSIEIEIGIYAKSFIHVNFDINKDHAALKACVTKLKLISENSSNMDILRVSLPSQHIREVIDALFADALISAAERAIIEESVLKKEKEDKQSSKVKDAKIVPAQKDVLQEMIKSDLDFIISLPLKPEEIVVLLTYAFSKDINEEYMKQSLFKYLLSIKLDREKWEEVCGCLANLATILLGYSNLESTFETCEQAIPTLKAQREIIASICLVGLNKKFTALSLHDRFCFAMEIFMMTDLNQLSMWPGMNQEALRGVFAGEWEDRNLDRSFRPFGGFPSLVLKAIWHEKFADDEIAIINESIAGSYLSQIIRQNFNVTLSAESDVESVTGKRSMFR